MPEPVRTPLAQLDPNVVWKPWNAEQWNPKWAAHFYRRAAFGFPGLPVEGAKESSWQSLQGAVKQGFDKTFEQMLAGGADQGTFNKLIDDLAAPFAKNNRFNNRIEDLQGWWLWVMLNTPHPLLERMTLFWHNHFATSFAKVNKKEPMLRQNLLLRKHAMGKFGPFLLEMSKDPAMLIWLDSNSNVKGKANENYAREVMELFSLGVGNYTEPDIREAARAFTGWHTDGEKFTFNKHLHDDGEKTVLKKTGNWDGGDIIRILLEQPACGRFLAGKLYRLFISENEAPPERLLEPIADQLRKSEYDIGAAVKTILRSRLFFSEYAYRQRVKSPVEYVVGLIRSMDGNISITALSRTMEGLGQVLFTPPNVKGWDGGKTWLNSATLLARHNLAWRLIGSDDESPAAANVLLNPVALAKKHAEKDPKAQINFFLDLFLQGDASDDARQKLVDYLKEGEPKDKQADNRLREVVHTILLLPEYQLA